MITRTLVVLTLAALAAGQDPKPEPVRAPLPIPGDPAPAMREDPRAPGPDRSGEPVAPPGGRLERDSFVADRFLAQGQRARYDFEARAGELSLFELTTYGYERGWKSAAEVSVVAPDGTVLAHGRAEGGAAYRLFLPCLAQSDGEHHLELVASEEFFRYTLVRHARFHAHAASASYALGERSQLFDWLADADDDRHYVLQVAAGERVGLRVLPSSEALRRQGRQARRTLLESAASDDAAMGERMRAEGMMSGADGMRAAADAPWSPRVDVTLDGEPFPAAGHYAGFVAPRAGSVDVRVSAEGGKSGGIYELVIERDPTLVHVHGTIADGEGDTVPMARIAFHREPELDWIGTVDSAEDGRYEIDVPPGEYTVLVSREHLPRPIVVRTLIEKDRELNAILAAR